MTVIMLLTLSSIYTCCKMSFGVLKFLLFVFNLRDAPRDVNVFIFQKNDRFVMKTTTKNRKRTDRFQKRSFFKKFVSKKWSFLKRSFFKTLVFKNDRFSKRSFL